MKDFTNERERWIALPGFFGVYSGSSQGRIRRNRAGWQTYEGRILNPTVCQTGYLSVTLTLEDKPQAVRLVHRLICETFHGPAPSPKHIVQHLNHERADNDARNLRWATRSEVIQHAYDQGRRVGVRGARHPRTRLTEADVRTMRSRAATGEPLRQLAAAFGISTSHASNIVRRVAWAWLR